MALIRDQIRLAFRHDGKDHVNLSIFGETVIGQNASPEFRKRFFIPHLGEFGSPRCFANWMCSGGDDTLRFDQRRYDTKNVALSVFRMYLLYGKFYQVLSIRGTYIAHKAMLDLPWIMYKKHLTGVREFDRWDTYPDMVKAMVSHVVEHDARAKFDWSLVNPRIQDTVDARIRQIAEDSGTDPDAVVAISHADDVAKERKAARKEQQDASKAHRKETKAVQESPGLPADVDSPELVVPSVAASAESVAEEPVEQASA